MPGDRLANDAGVSLRRWGQSTVYHVTWRIRTAAAVTPFSAHLRWIRVLEGLISHWCGVSASRYCERLPSNLETRIDCRFGVHGLSTRGRGFESHQSPFRHGDCSSVGRARKKLWPQLRRSFFGDTLDCRFGVHGLSGSNPAGAFGYAAPELWPQLRRVFLKRAFDPTAGAEYIHEPRWEQSLR